MVVIFVENAHPSLRGLLSRWMIQPKAGVFVGRLSARVRDKLWQMIVNSAKADGAVMIYGAQTEQHFALIAWGESSREPVDYEGLVLIRRPTDSKEHERHYRKRGQEQKARRGENAPELSGPEEQDNLAEEQV